MAKTCHVDPVQIAPAQPMWFLLAVIVLLSVCAFGIFKMPDKSLKVTMAPAMFDVQYKCRLCGAVNHVEEKVP